VFVPEIAGLLYALMFEIVGAKNRATSRHSGRLAVQGTEHDTGRQPNHSQRALLDLGDFACCLNFQ
jgi:hypothetical protein